MRSTVFERLRRELEAERLKQAAVVRKQNRDYCCEKRQRKRNAEWNVQACEYAAEEIDPTRQLWEQSGMPYGFISQLHPYLWRYHLDPFIARLKPAKQLGELPGMCTIVHVGHLKT